MPIHSAKPSYQSLPAGSGMNTFGRPSPSSSSSSNLQNQAASKTPVNPSRSSLSVPSATPTSSANGDAGRAAAAVKKKEQLQKELEAVEAEAKRRKVQRACDVCRRKKIRCEGPMTSLSDSKCANCEEYGFDCTYVEAAKRRGPPKGYVDTLEQRCSRMERLLQQVQPGIDINSTVGPVPDKDDFDLVTYHDTLRNLGIPPYPAMKAFRSPPSSSSTSPSYINLPAASAPSPSTQVLGPQPWRSFEQDPNRPVQSPVSKSEEAQIHASVALAMSKLDIKEVSWRFHGKSSAHHLIMQFNELRHANSDRHILDNVKQSRREEYWMVPEWELELSKVGFKPVDYSVWPDAGLDQTLIDAYFEYTNDQFPLLNQIIFNQQYSSGLHRTSRDFAKVCLVVFANGSRYVDDDRVYWPIDSTLSEEARERILTDADGTRKYSAGWKYLRSLLETGRTIAQAPNLFDFQCQVLVCAFLLASAIPHLPWIVAGVGIRAAQELGIHIRSILVHADPVERALYNRAFWCLYHIDRFNCSVVGRSVAIQDTDFDADYPIAVDDEYWDTGNPETDFIQPPFAGLSKITVFIHTLKLDHIIGAALRTIYAINKSPDQMADAAGKKAVVIELDSALNSWTDGVPDDLRWDPTRSDQRLFRQSAELYTYYYYCQILVHRQFIPTLRDPEPIGLPSLAICSNAARSICNIVDTVLRRGRQSGALPGRTLPPQFIAPAWIASVVLLINIYTGKPSPAERERAIQDIKKAIAALKDLEMTWRQAGKLTDVLTHIAKGVEANDDEPEPAHGQKRPYEPCASESQPSTQTPSSSNSVPPAPSTPPSVWPGQRVFGYSHPISAPIADPCVSLFNPPGDANAWGLGNMSASEVASYGELPTNGVEGDIWAELFDSFMYPFDNQQNLYQGN